MKIGRIDHEPEAASPVQRVFFSYGFRPFFLGTALYAGLAVPVWVLLLAAGTEQAEALSPARNWHVHEMVFGFLPAAMTGFLLTAIPNWTDRPPMHGPALMLVFGLWLAGRLVMAIPSIMPVLALLIDASFLVVIAGLVWRELVLGRSWQQVPVAVVITFYAGANMFYHLSRVNGEDVDLSARMALGLIMILLTLLGGRLVPNFTREFLNGQGTTRQPAGFSWVDALTIILTAVAALSWVWQPQSRLTGWLLMGAGFTNGGRMLRWYGWLTWREPLVLILHWGYAWVALALLLLGGSILGFGLAEEDALHALTTGAIGLMTLAVMTRATLGHTGRARHASPVTLGMYLLVTIGALVRVFGPGTDLSMTLVLAVAATSWSGAYLLFAAVYGPYLWRPPIEP